MVFSIKCHARSVTAGICVFLLALLLVACGGQNNNNTNESSNSSKSNNSSSNGSNTGPVQHALTPTMTSSASTTFKTYNGSDFTIKYPESWKLTVSDGEVVFTDPTGSYNMTIGTTSNPQGATASSQVLDSGIAKAKTNLKNTQTIQVPQTTTLDSQTWNQRSFTGTSTLNGQSSDVEAVVLATNYPAETSKTKGYVIVYVATKDQFDQAESTYFKPMLQSFKFTA